MRSPRHPEFVLAAAAVVCLPMLPAIMDGSISFETVLVRFLLAVVLCWAGGALLATMIAQYSAEARRAEILRIIEQAASHYNANAPRPMSSERPSSLPGTTTEPRP